MRTELLEPRRVRYPKGAYGWVELKVVTSGRLEQLGSEAALTYLFLCTVGNMLGLSFWSRPRMARTLGLSLEAVEIAIRRLREGDLIATNGRVVQILPLEAAVQGDGKPNQSPSVEVQAPAVSQRSEVITTGDHRLAAADLNEGEILLHESEARRQLAKITPHMCSESVRRVARAFALEARRDRRG
jgi:hypothetical protein